MSFIVKRSMCLFLSSKFSCPLEYCYAVGAVSKETNTNYPSCVVAAAQLIGLYYRIPRRDARVERIDLSVNEARVKGGDQDAGKSEVGRSRGPTWRKYRKARGWEDEHGGREQHATEAERGWIRWKRDAAALHERLIRDGLLRVT